MIRSIFNRHTILTVALMLVTVVSFSSCEPLRKKFTRKKKASELQSEGFQPVLEPQEYAAPERNTGEIYKQHYALIKVWYKDLWAGVEERGTDASVRYGIKQIQDQLDQMKVVLKYEKAKEIGRLQEILEFYKTSLAQPRQTRNYSRIRSDLREFDRVLRNQFGYEAIKDFLV